MPVDFESYEPSRDETVQLDAESNAFRIVRFLSEHPEAGFTPKEITERTGVVRGSVGTTLSRLEKRGLVRHKKPYWAIAPDEDITVVESTATTEQLADEQFGEERWDEWKVGAEDPRESQ